MDKAKAAVHDFMAKAGHHDTTVHEKVAPAVTHETVHHKHHENVTTAVDKEIHQDHYHTSVQPILDRQTLPEENVHNLAPVQHKEYTHGNDREVAARLEREAAQFTNKTVEGTHTETRAVAPTIAGEHIHHHVHETIQPVIQRETIQPHVVHTTIPVHEVHHNAAQHHTTSALPAVSLDEFQRQGGVLSGREERYDGFEGEPRSVGKALGGAGAVGAVGGLAAHEGQKHHRERGVGRTRSGSSSSSSSDEEYRRTGIRKKDRLGRNTTGNTTGGIGNTTGGKPSLMDKINPSVDANGDGKAGFMK